MTKSEFDLDYRGGRIAVHMPNKAAADILLAYVNNLCKTNDSISWDIETYPFLFMYSNGQSHTGWTGEGAYNGTYTKISFDEFMAAVNDLPAIVDVDCQDIEDVL